MLEVLYLHGGRAQTLFSYKGGNDVVALTAVGDVTDGGVTLLLHPFYKEEGVQAGQIGEHNLFLRYGFRF